MSEIKLFISNFSWFDFVALGVLIGGLIHGKNRGMSGELIDLLKWLVVIIVAGLAYLPLSNLLAPVFRAKPYYMQVGSYILIVIIIHAIFAMTLCKRTVREKFVGSDLFGKWEFYLGMVGGMLRFFCMLLIALAILNAKPVSEKQIAQKRKQQEETLGSSFFPSAKSLQYDVLYKSIVGSTMRTYFPNQLMRPVGKLD